MGTHLTSRHHYRTPQGPCLAMLSHNPLSSSPSSWHLAHQSPLSDAFQVCPPLLTLKRTQWWCVDMCVLKFHKHYSFQVVLCFTVFTLTTVFWKAPRLLSAPLVDFCQFQLMELAHQSCPHLDDPASWWLLSSLDFWCHKGVIQDFPGGPVAKTPRSQCREAGFHPSSGN